MTGGFGEFDFIADCLAPLADNETALGLHDDAANYAPPSGYDLVVTQDALVAGVHFPETAPPHWVAQRALACNLSDLAAKGAVPAGCLMSLGIGPDWQADWLRSFAAAFGRGLQQADMQLWGGDTVHSTTPFISLTLHGLVPHGTMLTRSGARIGDDIYVTGTIGDGWLGLQAALAGGAEADIAPYAAPQVALEFGAALRGVARAALDVSDGLAADLDHMCRASGCSMQIAAADVPLSPRGEAYLAGGGDLSVLLTGGDDLQIAFAAAPQAAPDINALAGRHGVRVSRIGCAVAAENGVKATQFLNSDGETIVLTRRGYSHF